MPLYEYECQSCGRRTEVIQRISDDPLETCEYCSGDLEKLISAPAFQFKGSGWYVTDSADKGGGKSQDDKPKDSGSGDSKTEKKATGSKDSGGGSSSKSKGFSGSKAEKVQQS